MDKKRTPTPASAIRQLLVGLVVRLWLALCLEEHPDLTSVCTDATGDALTQFLMLRKRRQVLKPEDREPQPDRDSSGI